MGEMYSSYHCSLTGDYLWERKTILLPKENIMSDKSTTSSSTPDQQASRSSCVITQEGEEVQVNINSGTGEVTYQTPCNCTNKNPKEKTGKSENIVTPVS